MDTSQKSHSTGPAPYRLKGTTILLRMNDFAFNDTGFQSIWKWYRDDFQNRKFETVIHPQAVWAGHAKTPGENTAGRL